MPAYPVKVHVEPHTGDRDRLTTAVRLVLAIPHLLLVGAFGSSGGLLGAVAVGCGFISWFAILLTGKHPAGLWDLAAFYLRWRVRAVAHLALFRDEYPPFGDAPYPAELELPRPVEPRDRVTVAVRLILAIPHILALCILTVAWFVTSVIAWFMILITGEYPEELYQFGLSTFRWSIRSEAYVLLLTDEYPPFSLD